MWWDSEVTGELSTSPRPVHAQRFPWQEGQFSQSWYQYQWHLVEGCKVTRRADTVGVSLGGMGRSQLSPGCQPHTDFTSFLQTAPGLSILKGRATFGVGSA